MAVISRNENPIFWHEINQYQHTDRLPRLWGGLRFVLLLLLIGVIAATLLLPDYPTRELGIYSIWVISAATVLRSIIAGANAISREHVGQTWDALVLTGLSARRILFGKWRAVLRRVAPWMLIMGTLRLAMLPVFLIALLNVFAGYIQSGYNYSLNSGSRYGLPDFEIAWVPWAALLAVIMSVVLTILEVAASTALGLAASALMRRPVGAAVLALVLRFIPVAYFGAFTRYELGGEASTYTVFRFAPFAIADSGTSPLSRLAVPYTPLSITTHADALFGLFLATVILVLYLVIALAAAYLAIRRSGALAQKA